MLLLATEARAGPRRALHHVESSTRATCGSRKAKRGHKAHPKRQAPLPSIASRVGLYGPRRPWTRASLTSVSSLPHPSLPTGDHRGAQYPAKPPSQGFAVFVGATVGQEGRLICDTDSMAGRRRPVRSAHARGWLGPGLPSLKAELVR